MKTINTFYLLALGVLIGIELAIGILFAPVIFYPQKYVGDGVLTHFQSGVLMTQIFLKFNIYLIFVISVGFLLEIINFVFNKYEGLKFRLFSCILSLIALVLGLLFVFYYTSYIVEAQKIGAIQTQSFTIMHRQSELIMKAMIIVQIIIFITNIRFRFKINKNEC